MQEQLGNPSVDVFSGKDFDAEDEENSSGLEMDSLFTVDEDALQDAFKFDESKIAVDTSSISGGLSADDLPAPPSLDASDLNLDMSDAFNQEAMGQMMGAAMAGYANALGAAYQEAMAGVAAGGAPPDFQTLAQTTLESYMGSAEFQGLIGQYAAQIVDANAMQREMATKISAALEQSMTSYMQQAMGIIGAKTEASVQQVIGQLQARIPEAMSVDADAFQNAFQMAMTEDELRELILSLMTDGTRSFDGNLAKLGYADLA